MTPAPANDNRPKWFDDLLMQYEPFLRGRCAALVPTDAESAYQESACRALAQWGKFKPDGSFTMWLSFIVRTIAHEMRVQAGKEVHGPVDSVDPNQEVALILQDEISSIPEEFSKPVLMAAMGYSSREIIAAHGGDRHAARWKLDKGRKMMRAANDNFRGRLRVANA